ncbi:MAG TPA: hypothetical protein PLG21_21855 [Anaerolineae bacterium]|nr:hypothetical protein [Anaerolineae bacterium]
MPGASSSTVTTYTLDAEDLAVLRFLAEADGDVPDRHFSGRENNVLCDLHRAGLVECIVEQPACDTIRESWIITPGGLKAVEVTHV